METKNQQLLVRSWVTDALIIGLVTFTFYLLALFYEVGFCKYFEIPYYFISLDTTTLLASSPLVIIILIFLFLAASLVYILYYTASSLLNYGINKGPDYHFSISISFFVIYLIISMSFALSISGILKAMIIAILFLVSIPIAFILVIPYISSKKYNKGDNSILPSLEKLADIIKISLLEKTRQPDFFIMPTLLIITVLTLLFGGGFFFFEEGRDNARKQEEFLVSKTKDIEGVSEVVIIRTYGENLLAVPLNRGKPRNKFEKNFLF